MIVITPKRSASRERKFRNAAEKINRNTRVSSNGAASDEAAVPYARRGAQPPHTGRQGGSHSLSRAARDAKVE
jgi:hypothetical protein